ALFCVAVSRPVASATRTTTAYWPAAGIVTLTRTATRRPAGTRRVVAPSGAVLWSATTRAVVPTSPFRSATVTWIADGVAAATLVGGVATTTRSGRRRTTARAMRARVPTVTVTRSRSCR